ncbi:site-specific integrase [Phenylobacterium montanum]|uniref:Site-specific integrase n=1 Tax=Phenylobacterium montanum TaxID=2823693 RepID=A0A975FVH5_9CAUL|nr:site-specific integrase [Caulobacter sp. S6]QUD86233.1 site-specific integrase [Caulobacter sp. S6]
MRNTQYLHQRNGRWYCRIRWPKEVWSTLGNGSFKKALGTSSREEAVILLTAAQQEFHAAVAQAKGKQLEGKPRPLGEGEITLVVARWFRDAQGAFKVDARPKQFDPQAIAQRRDHLARVEQRLAAQRERLGLGDYTTLYPIVEGVLERAGLNVDRDDPSFGLLCQTLMRAWIAMEERALAHMRGEFGFKPADTVLDDLASYEPPTGGAKIRTLDELITASTADRSDKLSLSTKQAQKPVYKLLRDCIGSNRDVRSVDREEARKLLDVVKQLPKGLGNDPELSKLPIPAAIATAQSLGRPTISAKTMNDSYMAHTKALFEWAKDEQWITSNPFIGLRVVDDVAPEDKRDPFTDDQLALIFNGAPWSTRETAPNDKPSLYWGPLICLYHGLRIGEPCGLLTSEVEERDGVPVINLRPNKLRPLKNGPSKRYLPIHPELIQLGFLDYVAERRASGDEQLFPEAQANAKGHFGDHVSDWFGRLLDKRGLTDSKLTLHSFRHTFEDALRDAEIFGTLEGAVLSGRKRGNDASAAAYGNGYKMKKLLGKLELVRFDTVRVPGGKDGDGARAA